MKKQILLSVLFLMLSAASFAQMQVTRFLRTPVDGFKKDMIQKLQEKGFEISDEKKDVLTGEFNGSEVNVFVATNNNKVCRIMVADRNMSDESDIKVRFNKLCHQFENNTRYVSMIEGEQTIPDDTDISYEMSVNNKRFEALYYQKIDYTMVDTLAIKTKMREVLKESLKDELTELKDSLGNEIPKEKIEAVKDISISYALKLALNEMQLKMPVWFCIEKFSGRYYICMYYDNEYNRANGEDL